MFVPLAAIEIEKHTALRFDIIGDEIARESAADEIFGESDFFRLFKRFGEVVFQIQNFRQRPDGIYIVLALSENFFAEIFCEIPLFFYAARIRPVHGVAHGRAVFVG